MRPNQVVTMAGIRTATLSQQIEDWIGSHVRAFEYFGGVTHLIVPDNLKSGVRGPTTPMTGCGRATNSTR